MEIIHARPDHLELLVPLFDQYRQFYQQSSDEAAARAFLAERLRKKDSVILLARDKSGTGAGFIQLYPSFTSVHMKRLWILNDLFVSPQARRTGVAKALVGKAIEVARETKSRGLVLETQKQNAALQKLVESLGWKRDEEFYVYQFTL